MLPSLSPPSRPSVPLRQGLWRGALRWLAAGLLLVLPLVLVACGGPGQPPRSVLLDALALQIQLTQGSIAQALELEAPGSPQVSRVRVEEQQAMAIGEARGLRLSGRFDWRLADDPIRVDSPFELFLARGERGQSWRLARPGSPAPLDPSAADPATTAAPAADATLSSQSWITYPLPLPGQRGRG
jgi:hypothetical protein